MRFVDAYAIHGRLEGAMFVLALVNIFDRGVHYVADRELTPLWIPCTWSDCIFHK